MLAGTTVVLNIYNAGWPDQVFIVYELTAGPDAGKGVYVAENLIPEVQVGQQVTTNTLLATLQSQFPNLEMGWADVHYLGQCQAMADHQAAAAGDAGATSTACGQNFDGLLISLGAPGGNLQGGSRRTTAC